MQAQWSGSGGRDANGVVSGLGDEGGGGGYVNGHSPARVVVKGDLKQRSIRHIATTHSSKTATCELQQTPNLVCRKTGIEKAFV
jgi:hypothetical protein